MAEHTATAAAPGAAEPKMSWRTRHVVNTPHKAAQREAEIAEVEEADAADLAAQIQSLQGQLDTTRDDAASHRNHAQELESRHAAATEAVRTHAAEHDKLAKEGKERIAAADTASQDVFNQAAADDDAALHVYEATLRRTAKARSAAVRSQMDARAETTQTLKEHSAASRSHVSALARHGAQHQAGVGVA